MLRNINLFLIFNFTHGCAFCGSGRWATTFRESNRQRFQKNIKKDQLNLRRFWTLVNRTKKNDVIEGWRHWRMLFFSGGSRPRHYIGTQGSKSLNKVCVMYGLPATGTRSPRIACRRSLWLAEMWHTTGLQSTSEPSGVKNQNGVEVQTTSNLAIGFPFFGTRSL